MRDIYFYEKINSDTAILDVGLEFIRTIFQMENRFEIRSQYYMV